MFKYSSAHAYEINVQLKKIDLMLRDVYDKTLNKLRFEKAVTELHVLLLFHFS